MKNRGQVLLTGLSFTSILSYISTVINREGILGAFITTGFTTGLIIATFLTLVAILGKVITEFTVFGNFKLHKLALSVAMIL